MSLDRTLKSHGDLAGRRSVLTRAERIERLTEEGNFDWEEDSALGLPKVRTIVARLGGGKKEEAEEAVPAAEGEQVASAEGEEAS